MATHTHRPERFQVYNLLEDGSGFTIKDCEHVFKFDKYKGWKDEDGNYYDSKGEPASQPSDADQDESSESEQSVEHVQSEEDEKYENLVEGYEYDSQSQENQESEAESQAERQARRLQAIEQNEDLLQDYAENEALRVFYVCSGKVYSPEAIEQAFKKQFTGIVIVESVLPEPGSKEKPEFDGYFVMLNKKKAQLMIEAEEQDVEGIKLHFQVQSVRGLLDDSFDNMTKNKIKEAASKKYKPKDAQQEKSKGTEVSTVNDPKSLPKYWCRFELFKDPKVFKEWMKEQGLTFKVDYFQLTKAVNEDANGKIWVRMNPENMAKCNNKPIKGTPVVFELANAE